MKFYNFVQNAATKSNELYITGIIGDDEWYSELGIESTGHKKFKEQLDKCEGDITVYIDSYGGDVYNASNIYTDLLEHKGNITVKIPAIAASAASIIAMAGDKVLMSPTAFMMIHNPITDAYGNKFDIKATLHKLETAGETIINAYERKTGLPRDEIQKYLDKDNGEGSWFDCNEAKSLGFCDGIIGEENSFANGAFLNSIKGERQRIYNCIVRPVVKEEKNKENNLSFPQCLNTGTVHPFYEKSGAKCCCATKEETAEFESLKTLEEKQNEKNAVNELFKALDKIQDENKAQARKREIEILNLKRRA